MKKNTSGKLLVIALIAMAITMVTTTVFLVVAYINDAFDKMLVPIILMGITLVEGGLCLFVADYRWAQRKLEHKRRKEYHKYVIELAKEERKPVSYNVYRHMVLTGNVKGLL